jgi:hypothetical protein
MLSRIEAPLPRDSPVRAWLSAVPGGRGIREALRGGHVFEGKVFGVAFRSASLARRGMKGAGS